MTTALEGVDESASRPGRSLLPGKTRCPLYRRLGGPHGRFGQVRNISPPPGFDNHTVQPVASRYTDYATRLTEACVEPNPFKVTPHSVWICHLKRLKPDGTTQHSLLRTTFSSALFPRIITHTIWQELTVLSVTLTTLQNKQAKTGWLLLKKKLKISLRKS